MTVVGGRVAVLAHTRFVVRVGWVDSSSLSASHTTSTTHTRSLVAVAFATSTWGEDGRSCSGGRHNDNNNNRNLHLGGGGHKGLTIIRIQTLVP